MCRVCRVRCRVWRRWAASPLCRSERLPVSMSGTVVVVRGELLQIGFECRLADPPVEVEEVGRVAIDELGRLCEPLIEESFVWWQPEL